MSERPGFRAGERSFHAGLYEWMERAPWLAISAAAHLLLFFVLAAIPWERLRREAPVITQARIEHPVEVLDEMPEPPPELPSDPVPLDEPDLVASDLADVPDDAASGDVDAPADPVFAPPELASGGLGEIGIGGGFPLGGPGGLHGPGRGVPRGAGIEPALEAALAWLAAHQEVDGHWDCDGFSSRCGTLGTGTCTGAGGPTHDVGVSALALLAFLGQGHTQSTGRHREVVARALAWLVDEQDPDSGLVGERSGHDFLYDHAIATLALCGAYGRTCSPWLRAPAQAAVALVLRARNPYGAWRYDVPPVGDSDTSVTGWMVFALAAAREAGLEGDYPAAFAGALSFLDEVTDPASGRVGYSALGELSARTRANEHFPRETGEAMTAVGLLCRVFLGERPETQPLLARHAERVLAHPPVWDPEGHTSDFYSWYYGTYALFQMGRPWWPAWEKAMKAAVVDSQRREGDARGSWDPIDAWGFSGGRVYATALMTLALEVYFRYGLLLGAR